MNLNPQSLSSGNKPQNSSKRAFFHDYKKPGYYLITATAYPNSPALSVLPDIPLDNLKKGEMIIPQNTLLGDSIKDEILAIPSYHPKLEIVRFVIMPDHIHFVVRVRAELKKPLGNELAGFFGSCSAHSCRISKKISLVTLFQPFHDRIIFDYQQLDRAIKYIEDNPRRLIVKRQFPDLFKRYLHLEIAGHEYAAFGNIFLLRSIYLLPVRIHRRWTEAEFKAYKDYCIREMEKGAVPISPAIRKNEKDILNLALDKGGSVIMLTDQGFEDRFKPKGQRFDLCAEGRLLLLAPWPDNTGRKSTAGYNEFHEMNDFAIAIASMSASTRVSLHSP